MADAYLILVGANLLLALTNCFIAACFVCLERRHRACRHALAEAQERERRLEAALRRARFQGFKQCVADQEETRRG